MSSTAETSEIQLKETEDSLPNGEEINVIENGERPEEIIKPQETNKDEKQIKIEETLAELDLEATEEDDKEKDEEETEEYEEINEDFLCQICDERLKMPKVLSCLHVFSQECLEKQLELENPDDPSQGGVIICVICGQETKVGPKGVAELQPDNVMVNLQDMEAIKKMRITCTSCKAKEKAVARCSDCANFLCPNCVTAHQYMRCFENHKVCGVRILST